MDEIENENEANEKITDEIYFEVNFQKAKEFESKVFAKNFFIQLNFL
jgi:hypothetical protein